MRPILQIIQAMKGEWDSIREGVTTIMMLAVAAVGWMLVVADATADADEEVDMLAPIHHEFVP